VTVSVARFQQAERLPYNTRLRIYFDGKAVS
jgi:hypothetical protein